jgi:hypothetical protein
MLAENLCLSCLQTFKISPRSASCDLSRLCRADGLSSFWIDFSCRADEPFACATSKFKRLEENQFHSCLQPASFKISPCTRSASVTDAICHDCAGPMGCPHSGSICRAGPMSLLHAPLQWVNKISFILAFRVSSYRPSRPLAASATGPRGRGQPRVHFKFRRPHFCRPKPGGDTALPPRSAGTERVLGLMPGARPGVARRAHRAVRWVCVLAYYLRSPAHSAGCRCIWAADWGGTSGTEPAKWPGQGRAGAARGRRRQGF